MRCIRTESGFSLIEVVIALGVLGFGILAMFSMQTFAIRGNAHADKVTHQATWGADGLERILTYDYDEIVDDGTRPDLSDYYDPNIYTVTWNVTPDSPLEDMARIQVTVTNNIDNRSVTLTYLKVDTNAF